MQIGNHQSVIAWADEYRCTACNTNGSAEELDSIPCSAHRHDVRNFGPSIKEMRIRRYLNTSKHRPK